MRCCEKLKIFSKALVNDILANLTGEPIFCDWLRISTGLDLLKVLQCGTPTLTLFRYPKSSYYWVQFPWVFCLILTQFWLSQTEFLQLQDFFERGLGSWVVANTWKLFKARVGEAATLHVQIYPTACPAYIFQTCNSTIYSMLSKNPRQNMLIVIRWISNLEHVLQPN